MRRGLLFDELPDFGFVQPCHFRDGGDVEAVCCQTVNPHCSYSAVKWLVYKWDHPRRAVSGATQILSSMRVLGVCPARSGFQPTCLRGLCSSSGRLSPPWPLPHACAPPPPTCPAAPPPRVSRRAICRRSPVRLLTSFGCRKAGIRRPLSTRSAAPPAPSAPSRWGTPAAR